MNNLDQIKVSVFVILFMGLVSMISDMVGIYSRDKAMTHYHVELLREFDANTKRIAALETEIKSLKECK